MYIHQQGRVRYRTLCNSDAPARAITTDSQRVSCPNCVSLLGKTSKKIFYVNKKLELGESNLKPGETITGTTSDGRPYIMGHNYTIIFGPEL